MIETMRNQQNEVADAVHFVATQIEALLADLKPTLDQYARLQAAMEQLTGARYESEAVETFEALGFRYAYKGRTKVRQSLGARQTAAIRYISDHGGCRVAELAVAQGVTIQHIRQVLGPLEEEEIVFRRSGILMLGDHQKVQRFLQEH